MTTRQDTPRRQLPLAGSAAMAAMGVALLTGAAQAEPAVDRFRTGNTVSCLFEGFSVDPDPAGLPVRTEPRTDAPSYNRLPPPRVVGVDEIAVVVRVVGFRDGWFRIDSAWFPGESKPGGGAASAPAYRGDGWVPVPTIKATLAGKALRTAPQADAPVRASLSGRRGGFPLTPDGVAVRRLLGCRGAWVEVDTEFGIGWVDRVCGRQLEPCS